MPIKNEPLVMTTGGVVQGALDGDINVFMGIPYAEPPVGDRRWRPPAPIKISRDPINTPERGSSSFQDAEMCKAIGGGDPTPLNEDCLYLNIWTPNLDETAKPLPVMVWIHGGGYVIGAGKLPPYVGKPLAERQAVVVNINYRLGHLGFFAHPALDREYHLGKRPVVNNFALLDQIEALKWVQSNITHFGGDPNNVTIFGQSAGGRSVLSLFASPLAGNLFHKGVAQSVYGLPDVPREFALQKGVIVATQLGLPGEDVAPSALRELDADAFWKIPFKPPTPISGDAVLPVPLFDVFKSGNQLRLPLIIGSNSDDSSVLNDFDFGPEKVINLLKERGMHELVKLLYPLVADDDYELGRQVGRDVLFTAMSYLIVEAHTAAGAPSWRYYFDYYPERGILPGLPRGARHADEVPYVLNTVDIAPPTDKYFTERDKDFADKVSHYWLEFARSAFDGSASIPGVVRWDKHITDTGSGEPPPANIMWFGRFGGNPADEINLESEFMPSHMAVFSMLLPIGPSEEQVHSYS